MKKEFLFLAILLLSVACSKKEKDAPQKTAAPLVNDLPAMPITLLDGTTFDLHETKGKNILILFQPDCDHCQHEATQIAENLESFKSYTLYFISSAAHPEIESFAMKYKLNGRADVLFGSTTFDSVISSFGPIPAPSLYIYSDQRLVKHFNGLVELSVIIKYL